MFIVIAQRDQRPLNFTEANVVLSDDRRIERVEIEQKNVLFVESFHRLNDVTSLIFFSVSLFIILIVFVFTELVRNNETSFDALMHD